MKSTAPLTAPAGSVSVCLRDHAELLERSPFSALGEDEVIDLVRANQRTIRMLEGVGSAAAGRLTELGGLSAEDVFSTVGKQSTGEARRVQRRGELAPALPSLTRGFMAGTIPTANVDTVASARHKLRHNREWQATFDAKDASITRKASRMNPKRFAGWMRELVDLVSDDGETEQQSQSDSNRFRSWTNAQGRWQARLDLDPLAGEKFQNAIDAEARSLAKRISEAGEEVHHGEHLNASAACSLLDSATGAKGRASINVVVDLDTLRQRSVGRHSQANWRRQQHCTAFSPAVPVRCVDQPHSARPRWQSARRRPEASHRYRRSTNCSPGDVRNLRNV